MLNLCIILGNNVDKLMNMHNHWTLMENSKFSWKVPSFLRSKFQLNLMRSIKYSITIYVLYI